MGTDIHAPRRPVLDMGGTTVPDARGLLAAQVGAMYAMAEANLEGMTHAESLISGGGNCANWILGHIVNVQNVVMRLAGAAPVWEDAALARAGSDPIGDAGAAIPWEPLRRAFLESQDRCVAALAALSEEDLSTEEQAPFGGSTTRAGLLGFLVLHQTYHAGQLALCRRAAGLPGAIKAPEKARDRAGSP